jgi:hypothetical protein
MLIDMSSAYTENCRSLQLGNFILIIAYFLEVTDTHVGYSRSLGSMILECAIR